MFSHLVGLSEIATMLGVSRQRVGQLVSDYDDFPAPVAELASGRIWETAAVQAWANAHPVRPPGRPSTNSGKRGSMTKRRRGWGEDSVYQDGVRWRGAISLGRTPDGRRRRVKVSGSTKAEVIAKLKEVRSALDDGVESPTRRLTVGAYLDRWIEGVPARVDRSTASDYADTVRLHLKPGLGSKILTKLSVSEVSALWASKRKAGYSANSIRIMRTVLRSALHQAEREGVLTVGRSLTRHRR